MRDWASSVKHLVIKIDPMVLSLPKPPTPRRFHSASYLWRGYKFLKPFTSHWQVVAYSHNFLNKQVGEGIASSEPIWIVVSIYNASLTLDTARYWNLSFSSDILYSYPLYRCWNRLVCSRSFERRRVRQNCRISSSAQGRHGSWQGTAKVGNSYVQNSCWQYLNVVTAF